MGSGIFNFLLEKNVQLVWLCSQHADIDKLDRQVKRRMLRLHNIDFYNTEDYMAGKKPMVTNDIHALSDCDLIIESIPEDLRLKKSLFLELDKIVKAEAILTSNSSSIKPSDYTPSVNRADKIAGLHFFYPVALKNIVEINLGTETSAATIEILTTFLEEIDRKHLLLGADHVFMLNKIFLDVQNEAWNLVEAGHCSQSEMDQMVRNNLFPFGIFDFFDSVGLDTMLASILNYTIDYPHRDYYSPLIRGLEKLVDQGKTGMKSGEGFYVYPHEPIHASEPSNSDELVNHLRQSWLSASKRFTARAHIPIEEANEAIKAYFGVDRGPFDQ